MGKLPPSGSGWFAIPDSCAIICWVRNASFADSSVGNDNASSRLFVCNDCAPPRIAERA